MVAKPLIKQQQVCCISDIHIGVHQNGAMWHDIAVEWASWLKTELRKHKIKDMLICGDLFHYRDEIAVNTIHITTQILEEWKEYLGDWVKYFGYGYENSKSLTAENTIILVLDPLEIYRNLFKKQNIDSITNLIKYAEKYKFQLPLKEFIELLVLV